MRSRVALLSWTFGLTVVGLGLRFVSQPLAQFFRQVHAIFIVGKYDGR